MTRRPDYGEYVVVPERAGWQRGRIWMRDLAKYLNQDICRIRRFARAMDLERYQPMGGGRHAEPYVTEYGAMRVIAYVRALQAAKRRDHHRDRERARRR